MTTNNQHAIVEHIAYLAVEQYQLGGLNSMGDIKGYLRNSTFSVNLRLPEAEYIDGNAWTRIEGITLDDADRREAFAIVSAYLGLA